MARRHDVELLRGEVQVLASDLRAEMQVLGADLRAEMRDHFARQLVRLVGTILASVGAILGLIAYVLLAKKYPWDAPPIYDVGAGRSVPTPPAPARHRGSRVRHGVPTPERVRSSNGSLQWQ